MENENDFIDRLSDSDLDNLIGKLCSARDNNPDVKIMDNIMNTDYIEQERFANETDNNIIEEDIINSIIKSGIPLSQEEMNIFKAKGLYEKYISKINNNSQEDDAMNSIEEEIRRNLEESANNEELVTEIVSEDEVQEQSFQEEDKPSEENNDVVDDNVVGEDKKDSKQFAVADAFKFPSSHVSTILNKQAYQAYQTLEDVSTKLSDTINEVTSGKAITKAMESMATEDDSENMSLEDFNDVPATELSVDDSLLTSSLMSKYNDVTAQEAMQLIDVMNRYKAGEKFDTFEALPDSLKRIISAEAMACGADKSTINFFTKSFINDLVNNTYLDKEIKDFNKELKEVLDPINNIAGSVMDEYSDEVYHKFTDKLEEKAEEIQNDNPEKANQLREVSKSFNEAIHLDRIIELIDNTPSFINKAYKTARDNFNKFTFEYNKEISKVNPTPRAIEFYNMGLKSTKVCKEYSDAYINTLIVLVADSVIKAIEKDTLTEHIYAYYASNAMYTIAFTNNNSEVNDIISKSIKYVLDKIADYMAPLEARNSKKNRKRNKKK